MNIWRSLPPYWRGILAVAATAGLVQGGLLLLNARSDLAVVAALALFAAAGWVMLTVARGLFSEISK